MAARRRAIRARNAPQTDLPISHGIVVGNLVYTSGQIGTNPKTGKLVPGGIEEQTRQTIENLAAILRAAGSSLDKGVKTTVYLTNMKEFPRMNSVYRTFFRREHRHGRRLR